MLGGPHSQAPRRFRVGGTMMSLTHVPRAFGWVAPVAILVAALSITAAAGGQVKHSLANQPIVIGEATAQTGTFSAYDVPPDLGAALAVKDINAKGGVLGRQLKVVQADDHSAIDQAPAAALKVLSQGANIGIVTCDYDHGAPAALVFQQHDIVSFAACAGSTKFGPTGIGPLAYTMGVAAAE